MNRLGALLDRFGDLGVGRVHAWVDELGYFRRARDSFAVREIGADDRDVAEPDRLQGQLGDVRERHLGEGLVAWHLAAQQSIQAVKARDLELRPFAADAREL